MVNAIENLYVQTGSYGNELTLSWNFPDILPEKYSLSLFRKTEAFVSNELDSYFSILTQIEELELVRDPNPQQIEQLELLRNELAAWGGTNDMIALTYQYIDNIYIDFNCVNGTTYYYQIYLKNSITHELSEPAEISTIPASNAKYKTFDVKLLVKSALERALQSVSLEELGQTELIEVFNEYLTDTEATQWILVQKSSNDVFQRYIGDSISESDDKIVTGHIEKIVIDVNWYFKDDLSKLDILNNFFRSRMLFMKRYLLLSGLIDAQFSFKENIIDNSNETYTIFSSGMKVTILADVTNELTLDTAPIVPDYIPSSPED
ncbi:MAG: hypothetical protein EHM58_00440 [Ignavibacteriae bacterium]|nr:MAG: hypothetical protein EHM58_00440 [Ignavibacteriota bacterium]